ncbi:MAG: hypothetical protein AB4352_01990 [Hormoscilla sp.]
MTKLYNQTGGKRFALTTNGDGLLKKKASPQNGSVPRPRHYSQVSDRVQTWFDRCLLFLTLVLPRLLLPETENCHKIIPAATGFLGYRRSAIQQCTQ